MRTKNCELSTNVLLLLERSVDRLEMRKHMRYVLGQEERKHLVVEPNVHLLVKCYAREKNITIAEATHILLGKALTQEAGLEMKDDQTLPLR